MLINKEIDLFDSLTLFKNHETKRPIISQTYIRRKNVYVQVTPPSMPVSICMKYIIALNKIHWLRRRLSPR